jgi:hypothetical protein
VVIDHVGGPGFGDLLPANPVRGRSSTSGAWPAPGHRRPRPARLPSAPGAGHHVQHPQRRGTGRRLRRGHARRPAHRGRRGASARSWTRSCRSVTARHAADRMRSNEAVGKIVLEMPAA